MLVRYHYLAEKDLIKQTMKICLMKNPVPKIGNKN
jgi:hypothetical protein